MDRVIYWRKLTSCLTDEELTSCFISNDAMKCNILKALTLWFRFKENKDRLVAAIKKTKEIIDSRNDDTSNNTQINISMTDIPTAIMNRFNIYLDTNSFQCLSLTNRQLFISSRSPFNPSYCNINIFMHSFFRSKLLYMNPYHSSISIASLDYSDELKQDKHPLKIYFPAIKHLIQNKRISINDLGEARYIDIANLSALTLNSVKWKDPIPLFDRIQSLYINNSSLLNIQDSINSKIRRIFVQCNTYSEKKTFIMLHQKKYTLYLNELFYINNHKQDDYDYDSDDDFDEANRYEVEYDSLFEANLETMNRLKILYVSGINWNEMIHLFCVSPCLETVCVYNIQRYKDHNLLERLQKLHLHRVILEGNYQSISDVLSEFKDNNLEYLTVIVGCCSVENIMNIIGFVTEMLQRIWKYKSFAIQIVFNSMAPIHIINEWYILERCSKMKKSRRVHPILSFMKRKNAFGLLIKTNDVELSKLHIPALCPFKQYSSFGMNSIYGTEWKSFKQFGMDLLYQIYNQELQDKLDLTYSKIKDYLILRSNANRCLFNGCYTKLDANYKTHYKTHQDI